MAGQITEPYTNSERANLAMVVTLVSFAMLFATLFLMYALYRFSNTTWPPMGFKSIQLGLPLLSTIIIGFSSWTFSLTQRAYVNKDVVKTKSYFYITLLLGLGFLGSQLRLWSVLKNSGFYVDSGVFPSLIYGFTWIHAAHVVLGIIALLFCLPLIWKKKEFKNQKILRLKNVGKFWHFLGVVWVFMFLILFVF